MVLMKFRQPSQHSSNKPRGCSRIPYFFLFPVSDSEGTECSNRSEAQVNIGDASV